MTEREDISLKETKWWIYYGISQKALLSLLESFNGFDN